MKLAIKRVEGIDEPVKLVSAMGFAVGAQTNKVYAWGIDYSYPSVNDQEDEEERLDGAAAEEVKAQLVQDPCLEVTHAFPVPY